MFDPGTHKVSESPGGQVERWEVRQYPRIFHGNALNRTQTPSSWVLIVFYFQAFNNNLPVIKIRGDHSFPCRTTLGDEEDRTDPSELGLHSAFRTCEDPSVLGSPWYNPWSHQCSCDQNELFL